MGPNVAVDEYGNKGRWTLIYNQGFEITVNERVYFAFSHFVQVPCCFHVNKTKLHVSNFFFAVVFQNGSDVISYCDRTLAGWSHDVLGHNWACFRGRNTKTAEPKVHFVAAPNLVILCASYKHATK